MYLQFMIDQSDIYENARKLNVSNGPVSYSLTGFRDFSIQKLQTKYIKGHTIFTWPLPQFIFIFFESHGKLREENHSNKLTHNESQAKFLPSSWRRGKQHFHGEGRTHLIPRTSRERRDKHTQKYMWINDLDFAELNIWKQREGCHKHRDNNQVEKEFLLGKLHSGGDF